MLHKGGQRPGSHLSARPDSGQVDARHTVLLDASGAQDGEVQGEPVAGERAPLQVRHNHRRRDTRRPVRPLADRLRLALSNHAGSDDQLGLTSMYLRVCLFAIIT